MLHCKYNKYLYDPLMNAKKILMVLPDHNYKIYLIITKQQKLYSIA